MANDGVVYLKAAPEFVDLDSAEDGAGFVTHLINRVSDERPMSLVIDISNCFLDYWGCAPLIEKAIDILTDSDSQSVRTLAILTTMNYGKRDTYASLFFKGSRFEQLANNFLGSAFKACKDSNIEFKIWVVPASDFKFATLAALRNPDFVLSSH